ncbi:hypothetical protein MAR_017042 [Mya arenaria]|uniref:Uncharacterized protein n=1 Tax=Mya arenaria TaxID=6604 RepID=A0ABY7EF85_MYAAR|nr:hypothetical protein MAR_017042 [Mya arenaria]
MLGRRGALSSTVNAIKRDIEQICQSGNYYVTEELGNEFNTIANGLDHLKLDGNLITSSSDWQKGFDSAQITAHAQYAQNALDTLAATLYDYKSKMETTSELNTFTTGAADRIKQFGDHIGVTDRYTGYRNNLTRGSREPFKLGTSWVDKNTQGGYLRSSFQRSNTYGGEALGQKASTQPRTASAVRFGNVQPARVENKGYQTVDSIFPRSNTMFPEGAADRSQALANLKTANTLNASASNSQAFLSQPRGQKNMSVQEQAGINTTFPGRTEYMTRYKSPPTDVRTSHFIVNPTPNFMLHGRPLGLTSYSPSFTEYQTRYEWPDSNKIVKLPWRRN